MPTDQPTGATYIAAAHAIAPRVRAAAAEIEASRRLPLELVDALRDAGLMHLLLPRDLGGHEVDPVTCAQVAEIIAAADASAGWCVMLAAQNATFAGFFAPDVARAVWGSGGIVAGTARPIGRATRTTTPAAGYRVSGRWPIASGSTHATTFLAECLLYDDGSDVPHADANGEPLVVTVLVPRGAVTVHDTWNTVGLRGTASNDFSVADTFVPDAYTTSLSAALPQHAWPLYRVPALAFINHGAHALGVASAAIESATTIIQTRRGWANQPLAEVARLQATLAEATVLVAAAREYLYAQATRVWEHAITGEEPAARERSRLRLAMSHAMSGSVQAVDLLHRALATSAVQAGSPLDRQFRDLHTAAAHVMVGPMTYEAAGRVELGQDAAFPFF